MIDELAPDETTVDFGLKIGGETGVIVAKGTAEVNFLVSVSTLLAKGFRRGWLQAG
jgi:Trypsin-co-occurring domain 1